MCIISPISRIMKSEHEGIFVQSPFWFSEVWFWSFWLLLILLSFHRLLVDIVSEFLELLVVDGGNFRFTFSKRRLHLPEMFFWIIVPEF